MHTFTHPPTGKRHLLDSSPSQKTIRYPATDEFMAQSYCGCASVTLRMGDLTQLPVLEADLDDDSDWCQSCVTHGPIVSATTGTDSTDDQPTDATNNVNGQLTSY